MRADEVIVIDDEGEEAQVDIPAPEAPSLSIKVEQEDLPQDSEEPGGHTLRRSTRSRVQRQLFSPRTKGQYHKAVGFVEPGGESRSVDHQDETLISPTSTEELDTVRGKDMAQEEGESELIGNKNLLEKLRCLESIRALIGVNSRGAKDEGVGHPPRAQVKEDQERVAVINSYQDAANVLRRERGACGWACSCSDIQPQEGDGTLR